MNTDRELMQQALEALEEIALAGMSPAPEMIDSKEEFHARQAWRFIGIAARQLTAIREALAEQPAQQQEPVAWRELCRRLYIELYWCDRQMMETLDADGEPMWTQGKTVRDALADAKAALDTSPPASKPLTDEQIDKLPWGPHEGNPMTFAEGLRDFARAIEAAHGIRSNDAP